jgi:hypothetical protein
MNWLIEQYIKNTTNIPAQVRHLHTTNLKQMRRQILGIHFEVEPKQPEYSPSRENFSGRIAFLNGEMVRI